MPGLSGGVAPWGWARPRRVRGVGSLRPRRARCGGCLVTHVLLPVTVLLRRADAVEVIGAALTARAAGLGHRRIAVWLGVPAGTVRGWLRRWAARLEVVRVHFMVVARLAGVDRAVPKALGVAVAGRPRGGGRGDGGGDRPVRDVRGDRPGDGVAGRVGVQWRSASLTRVAGGFGGCRCQHELPLTAGPLSWIVARVIARQHLSGDPSDDE